MNTIGFDTSNYTTSIAAFDGKDGLNCSQLLPVKQGQLGLPPPRWTPPPHWKTACRKAPAGS